MMFSPSVLITAILCLVSPASQVSPQPAPSENNRPADREAGGQRRNRDNRSSQQNRRAGRPPSPQPASSGDREPVRLDRWLGTITRRYGLDEAQQLMARQELETLQAERRTQMGADAEEYELLRQQVATLVTRQQATIGENGNPREARRLLRGNPEFEAIQARLRELDNKYPIDLEAATQRIEQLLPVEQVQQSRARVDERRARQPQRRPEQAPQERNRRAGRGDPKTPTGSSGEPLAERRPKQPDPPNGDNQSGHQPSALPGKPSAETERQDRSGSRLDRWMGATTRLYGLDEAQQALVRKELETMQAERRAKMGTDAAEYDQLQARLGEYAAQRRAGRQERGGDPARRPMREDPEYQQLRARYRQLNEQYPLDLQAARQRVEKLLPEAQVVKARQQIEERRVQQQQRNKERTPRREARRTEQRNRSPENPVPKAPPPPLPTAPSPNNPTTPLNGGQGQPETPAPPVAAVSPPPSTPPLPAPKPLHPWEQYVKDFSVRYQLTHSQMVSAEAVLKDVTKRASQVEMALSSRIAEARQIKDSAVREARIKELNKPLDQLFEELKRRLDALLTGPQRSKKA